MKDEKFHVNNRGDAADIRPVYDERLLAYMTKNDIPNVLNRAMVDAECPVIPYPWPQPPPEPYDAAGNINVKEGQKWTIADKIYRKHFDELVVIQGKHGTYDMHHRKMIQFISANFPVGSTAHNSYTEIKTSSQKAHDKAFLALNAIGADTAVIIRNYKIGVAPIAPVVIALFAAWQTASEANSAKSIWRAWEDWWLDYSLPQSNAWKPHWEKLCKLTDLDMDISEFIAEWTRVRYLVEISSSGAITDEQIAFQLCEAIHNIKLQDDVKDFRLDLDNPIANRKYTEKAILARFQKVITAFPAFNHPTSQGNSNLGSTPRSFYGQSPAIKKDKKSKPKAKKATHSSKASPNDSSSLSTSRTSPSASKKQPSTSSRAASTSPVTSTPLERTVHPDGPYPSRQAALPPATGSNICNRCGRRGHYAFKCKETSCNVCGIEFSNWKFFHNATQCK